MPGDTPRGSDAQLDDARRMLSEAIRSAVPSLDAPLVGTDPGADLWAELELDSMEHVAVIEQLAAAIGNDIPDRDVPHLLTIDQIARYVADRIGP